MAEAEHTRHDGQSESINSHDFDAANGSTTQGSQEESVDSIHTATDDHFRPEGLTLEKAQSLGYPTEQTLPSESVESHSTSDALEKGIVAPILIQQELGAQDYEKSDVAPVMRRGHIPGSSHNSTWRISVPPNEMPKLPYKQEHKIFRDLRHNLLNVYQRLFSVVFIGNMIAFIIELVMHRHSQPFGPPLGNVATAAAANILGAILIRQEYVINGLYTFFCWTPHWTPFRIRRMVAKLYHFGGVHSGCAISATVWFILYTALVTKQYADGDFNQPAVIAITYILLVLFLSICIFAIPKFRIFSHNTFEAIHRFAGWVAVALFWVEILLVLHAEAQILGSGSLGILVIQAPAFWFLLIITFFIILPWLRLRKVPAYPEVLSNHAVRIHFKYMKMGPILGIRITHNPMKEWHAFATVPEKNGSSFSLIVSDNGDWTKKQIMEPSNSYWIRGVPITGVLRMAMVFKRVVVVTTGSGIGPCLSMLVAHPMPCRILWSTPNPLQTYGENILQLVTDADPDAMIINTRASGRPDMVALAYHMYLESKAEAVFIISNPYLTRKVVYGMQSRGIPAYGPIWDS
ncbi:hypothetical protein OEA41_003872 [Lepraria neglecta]|uniref:Integral membrane protein TmpA n=1 Tax=Lepraria neglecta TaxID=209136 RepID=A0AAD9Z989_9LECA|nr:hypothetical protein OEA41_003872 [Lepraria neglecta]